MKQFVYIVQSIPHPGEYYVGVSHNPDARLAEHNAGKSLHTRKYKPWRLVHYSWFESEAKALAYEKYLKSGSGRAFAIKRLR